MKNFPKDPDRDYSLSNAEIAISSELWKREIYGVESQKKFWKLITVADFYIADVNLAVFIDGEQVHQNKELQDSSKRDFVRSQGCTVRVYTYKAPLTKKRLTEIVDQIVDDVIGLRKMRQ